MELTIDQYVERIAAQVVSTKNKMDRELFQRRDQVTDLHGTEFIRQSSPELPATFYLSISRDMIYLSRFGFKLLISPYAQLSPTRDPIIVPVGQSGFRVKVDDVDVSAYLAAQYNGWIGGEGIYPSTEPGEMYDLLEASSDMRAAGNITLAEKIVSQGIETSKLIRLSPLPAQLKSLSRITRHFDL